MARSGDGKRNILLGYTKQNKIDCYRDTAPLWQIKERSLTILILLPGNAAIKSFLAAYLCTQSRRGSEFFLYSFSSKTHVQGVFQTSRASNFTMYSSLT